MTGAMNGGAEMPRYRCHKEVHALKIESVQLDSDGVNWINPADPGFARFPVTPQWVAKHHPHGGGYYVVYKDGYKSFSPAEAFEDGYTRL